MNLVPLFEEALEFQNYNGTVLSNGKAAVYYIGRTRLADIYNDVAAEYPAENPRILDNLGMGPVYVNPAFDYELVVFDAYDNELFSVKKYIHSKGEHSTANVVVTPSENIAVSAWTVGDVQIYMPYLTGQLGKVYEGVDPIVVNNVEDKISANHVPLGVQDPLYFVQDDEEGCIIGFSGQTIPEGVMSESGLGFENDKITGYNGSAFSAGNEYEAGSYVDITDNTISVTGLPTSADVQNIVDVATSGLMPSGDYLTKESADTLYAPTGNYLTGLPDDLVYSADITGFATTAQLDEKLDKSDSGNFYPMDSNPSGYINELPSDLATTGWVDSQGYLTAVDIPESATWNATTQTVSANSAQWAGGTANPQIPVTGINGIKISESGDKVVFEVSADYAEKDWVTAQGYLTAETDWTDTITAASANAYEQATAAIPPAFDPSYISAQVDTKLNSAIYAADSGTFLTALPQDLVYTADIADMATTGDLTGKQDITGMTAYATVESLTAKQDAGSYLSSTDSANFLLTSDSGNFYPSDNPSAFITGVDLTPYQLTADMTAYQPAGAYLTTGDSANFYTTANESGFISEVPVGTMNESAFEYDANDKISGYNGSAFAGGSDVPEGVMVESGLEYNAINQISGYNGSAIAQYGHEAQWLVHDDTLVHASNSAQYALGVNLSAVAQLLGIDETEMLVSTANSAFTLSEPFSSFSGVKIKLRWWDKVPDNYYDVERFTTAKCSLSWTYFDNLSDGGPLELAGASWTSNNGLNYNLEGSFVKTFNSANTAVGTFTAAPYPLSIVGIGRKS